MRQHLPRVALEMCSGTSLHHEGVSHSPQRQTWIFKQEARETAQIKHLNPLLSPLRTVIGHRRDVVNVTRLLARVLHPSCGHGRAVIGLTLADS